MLITNVDIGGELSALRIREGRIAAIDKTLTAQDGEPVYDGGGGALLPGLHDHHIHIHSLASALRSVPCGPPQIRDEAELIAALQSTDEKDELRGIGYHASVAGEIDRHWLDANAPDRPVRIQHRSGRLWILNSRAMELYGISAPLNGRVLDQDNVFHRNPQTLPDLSEVRQTLLSYGITGLTEVTPGNGPDAFAHLLGGLDDFNLVVMGIEELGALKDTRVGPLKLHYHDHDLPPLDQLTRRIQRAHEHGRAVASHCVTRAELMLNLAAFEAAGVSHGDRIEHAAIAEGAAIEWIKALGLTVVTQPGFLLARAKAYLQDVPSYDHAHLWRVGGFVAADIPLALSSDAPFGPLNPWANMDAACNRPPQFGADDEISPEQALALYSKPAGDAGAVPRQLKVGARADLCVLNQPWAVARQNLSAIQVQASWLAGVCAYERNPLSH